MHKIGRCCGAEPQIYEGPNGVIAEVLCKIMPVNARTATV